MDRLPAERAAPPRVTDRTGRFWPVRMCKPAWLAEFVKRIGLTVFFVMMTRKQKGRVGCGLVMGLRPFSCREDGLDPFPLRLFGHVMSGAWACCVLQTWQRPTLPRLETKYHWRRGVSRPCSEWERVQPPRNNHQVSEAQHLRSWQAFACFLFKHVLIFCLRAAAISDRYAADGAPNSWRRTGIL